MTNLIETTPQHRVAILTFGALVMTASACGGGEEVTPLNPGTTSGSNAPSVDAGPGGTTGAMPSTGGTTAGTDTGSTAGTTGGTTGGATGSTRGLPCDVQTVVDTHCASCHSDPPVSTYMPLVTQAHFHAQSTTDTAKKYYELAAERVVSTENPMPPVTEPALSEAERSTLTAWLEAGAPSSTETCAASPDAGVPMDDGRELDTSGLECYQFLAHAPNDKSTKFKVGAANDAYFNMIFEAPWEGMVYGVVVKPIIDNAQVLHHWLLYKEPGAGADGTVETSGGQHSDGELVHGWAPGGVPLDFRKFGSVGFELPSTTYLVEFHYNSADANAEDASGVEVCVVREPPEEIAGLSWLGLDHGVESYVGGALLGPSFSGACLSPSDEWVGTCDPQGNEPITLMFVVPHMHEAGTHMKAVIDGPNGSRVLHDEPFDFNYQKSFEVNDVLMPGETITTTCSFSAPKCAGQATGAEMCYLYTYAYPKGALTDGASWGELAHGEGTCLGQ